MITLHIKLNKNEYKKIELKDSFHFFTKKISQLFKIVSAKEIAESTEETGYSSENKSASLRIEEARDHARNINLYPRW